MIPVLCKLVRDQTAIVYFQAACRSFMIIKDADFDVNTSKVQSKGITIAV